MGQASNSDGMTAEEALRYIRSATAIRERCETLFQLGAAGKLDNFSVDLTRLPHTVELVRDEILRNYPDLNVPFHSRWRHFDVGNVPRLVKLGERLSKLSSEERARAKIELAIVSVLLDAGAGAVWGYRDSADGNVYRRSEGLAVASFDAFVEGAFGSPCSVDAKCLEHLDGRSLEVLFQVSEQNPLLGVSGRVSLMNRLGAVVGSRSDVFVGGRLGGLYDSIVKLGASRGVEAADLLVLVLDALSAIWPGRMTLNGHNLGDVWSHSKIDTGDLTNNLVPFHKLSQWMTYSLLEPLAEAGVEVRGLDHLTGLAEYRNGGLFVDTGVLCLKDPAAADVAHLPSSELIVEWRALTIALLDRAAGELRRKLGVTEEQLPLAKVLQGGTWSVGRALAAERRNDGSPPIMIQSDGTVF